MLSSSRYINEGTHRSGAPDIVGRQGRSTAISSHLATLILAIDFRVLMSCYCCCSLFSDGFLHNTVGRWKMAFY